MIRVPGGTVSSIDGIVVLIIRQILLNPQHHIIIIPQNQHNFYITTIDLKEEKVFCPLLWFIQQLIKSVKLFFLSSLCHFFLWSGLRFGSGGFLCLLLLCNLLHRLLLRLFGDFLCLHSLLHSQLWLCLVVAFLLGCGLGWRHLQCLLKLFLGSIDGDGSAVTGWSSWCGWELYIAIHSGANDPCDLTLWQVDPWEEVGSAWLMGAGVSVVVIGGREEGDQRLSQSIFNLLRSGCKTCLFWIENVYFQKHWREVLSSQSATWKYQKLWKSLKNM